MTQAAMTTEQSQNPTAADKPRVALITGGTGAIGSEIARRLAREGHTVVTTYRNEDKAKAWQDEMKREGYAFHLYQCDVADFDSAAKMVEAVKKDLGPVEILVNCAGITRDTTLRKMSHDQWRDVLSSNLDSVFNVTRPVLDHMLETGFGRIINISSINGSKGQFGQSNYSAAKAGMHGFTKSLAQEVAKKGITVNTVAPGYIETEMILGVPENIRQGILAQIPVGRFGTPQDVAHAVAFLVKEDSGFITGANLASNGGHYME
jgi:acetoacetyl-CoA reductase